MHGFIHLKQLLAAAILTASVAAFAQAPQQTRVLGVVTEKQGVGAKVKTDAGDVYDIVFAPQTKFQKIAPGQTSLKDATDITMGDINSGDRVLARGTATDAKTVVALSVILMSKTDLADKQQKERMDWTRRGISGTVTAVSAPTKEITIRLPQVAAAEQLVKVTLKDNAPSRRYTQDSVKFADAKISLLTDVKPGDQLRARGDKSEDGTKFTADEIVTGSFQTVAMTVVSVNAEAKELQVKNLDTNKVMTVRLTADSTVRRIPEGGGMGMMGGMGGGMMGGGGPGGPGGAGGGQGRPQGAPAPAVEGGRTAGSAGPGGPGGGPGGPGGGAPGGRVGGFGGGRMPDLSQIMERMPASTLAEVKVGETLIVAGTKGASPDRITAITMLTNAEAFVNLRRAAAARAGIAGGFGGPGGNWSPGDMSMMPMP